jgi:DNA-directed RNA polymerase specialized sigma24 family protein
MTTDPNYQSDQEIVKRVRQHLAEALQGGARPARKIRLGDEVDEMMQVLAGRIYAAPEVWGLSSIPQELRDDVAHDVLLDLFRDGYAGGERGGVAEWFAKHAERRFRELWGRAKAVANVSQAQGSTPPFPVKEGASEIDVAVLDTPGGPWQRFEQQFPRDAFALRLRYVLNRSPEEMMVMLDNDSTGAVHSRLSRARGRMRMFFEQSGYDRNTILAILRQFGDAPGEEGEEA